MTYFLKPSHWLGLALVIGLVVLFYIGWPWPFFALRFNFPDVHKMLVLPVVRDYQGIIAYLVPIVMLSITHFLWNWIAAKFSKPKE